MENTIQARPSYGGDMRPTQVPQQFSVMAVPGEVVAQTNRLHTLLRRMYSVADGLAGAAPDPEVSGKVAGEPNNVLDACRTALTAQSITIDMLERQFARIENSLGVARG